MDDLLTTKQLQDLLQVDRITIYRMLSDGRLHGFKVGGQWRFSRQEIEAWLQQQSRLGGPITSTPHDEDTSPISQVLPISCIQAIQDVCAEALDIGAITTDLDGRLLSSISNSCEYCRLILSGAEGQRRCADTWRQASAGQVGHCHAGLLCSSASIQVGAGPVAVVAGCQFATGAPVTTEHSWHAMIPAIASDLSLAEQDLRSAASSVRVVPEVHVQRICRLIVRVADTFSEIGQERLDLLSRLQHIAEMSRI